VKDGSENMLEGLEAIKGVGDATASKLRRAGFTTLEAVAVTPLREIMFKTGLGYENILKITQEARKLVHIDFTTAKELWERRKGMLRCSTGSQKLNELLGGGIETQAMTEMIGEYGVGKTQICLMLSATAQLPKSQGGLEGNVMYIDTEGTFSPERVYNIASAMAQNPDQTLNNIILCRVYNSDHQSLIIDHLFKKCPEENVKLVIVDSMISHFRGEYLGRESLAERQQLLNQNLHKLLRLSEAFNLAVVVTNQVQATPMQVYGGNPNRPSGCNIMAHACTHRIYIMRGKKGTRKAKVIDSPYLPESKASFIITAKGIEDAPDADTDTE